MQENINISDSTITTNLSFRQLVLMNMQQLTNFPYIEKDFDALTDYELLSLVVKYLNNVIANQNEQNDSITRMYESFLALQTYVNNTKDTLEDAFNNLDNYVRTFFENLDLKEEVNVKLDQMLEDGVLEQIIEQFLQLPSLICFDNVDSMKSAPNLANGSYAKTLGYYDLNDGGEALYKISNTQITNHYETLDSGLYANLINDKINIKQYGCYGDNTHDDSSIIKEILENLSNNAVVYIPNGHYKCETDISVTANDIRIYGDGQLQSTIDFNNNGSIIFKGHGIKLQNLRFTKQAKIELDSYHNTLNNVNIDHGDLGLLLKDAYITEVTNCYLTFNKVGAVLDNQSFEIDFTDCVIDNNQLGVLITKTTGSRFINCTIEGNRNTTTNKGCGLAFSTLNADIQITGCWFEANGTSNDSVDILSINDTQESTFDELISQIQSLYAFTRYSNTGQIILSGNHHAFTKYGVVHGGYLSNMEVSNCYFTGVLEKNNKAILILSRANTIHNSPLKVLNNNIVNTGNSAITTEMKNGIKGSYVYTNAELIESEYPYLITNELFSLDNEPLFVYQPYLKDMTNVKHLHQWQSGGTSYTSGMLLGTSTNSYVASTPAIYVNDNGTTQGGTNIFDQTGDTTYAFISTYGSTIQTRRDNNVPTSITPIAEGLFRIRRDDLHSQTAFVVGANSVHYMLIQFSNNEKNASKQCIAMKPKDYYPNIYPKLT